VSETVFRFHMAPGSKPLLGNSVKSSLIVEIMCQLIGRNLFSDMDEHVLSCEPLSDHRTIVLKNIINQYLVIRLHHHQAKSYTRILQGEKVRTFLNKTVTFKGQ